MLSCLQSPYIFSIVYEATYFRSCVFCNVIYCKEFVSLFKIQSVQVEKASFSSIIWCLKSRMRCGLSQEWIGYFQLQETFQE